MHPRKPDSRLRAGARYLTLVGLILPVLLTGCPLVPYGKAIYVDQNNPSNIRDGKTWGTAFHAIQAGIDAAQQNGIGEVWVAQGTYDELRATAANGSLVMADGVDLYGGFAGTESARTERNPALYPTVIDGSKSFSGDAAWHVITGARAILDGFTVTGGNAGANQGGTSGYGGGMYNYGVSPQIANCTFKGNTAVYGGAMFNYGAQVEMTNCGIHDNVAMDGAGVYNLTAAILATNCLFYNNLSLNGAGAALFETYGASILTNCSLYGNVARLGAIYALNASPQLTNCIVWGNKGSAFTGDAAVVDHSDIEGGYADTANSNIDADPLFFNPSQGDLRIAAGSPCVDQGTAADAPATDITGVTRPQGGGIDMGAYEVTASGLPQAVFTVSPAVGAVPLPVAFTDQSWTGGAAITAWAWDFGDGATSTLRNPTHTYTQVGVYTVSLTVTTSLGSNTSEMTNGITVNQAVLVDSRNTSGVEDGTSWTAAFTTIQPAIEKAAAAGAGEVWVAAGTYTGTGETVITLRENVQVYGGFAGTETSRDQRNTSQNTVILDGETKRRCVVGADKAVFDGFTVTRGHAADYGGGMYNSETSPTLADCTFTQNTAQWGGAIFSSNASPVIENCYFLQNQSTEGGYGGAVFASDGTLTLSGSAFTENESTSGGAVFISGADGELSECIFTRNTAKEGGAVYNHADAAITLTECVFAANEAEATGGAVRNRDASPIFDACTFENNTAANNGGAIASTNGSPTLTACTFTGNESSNDGGAVSCESGSAAIANGLFSDNSAARNGGALFFDASNPTVETCSFTSNSGASGGAVSLRGGTGTFTECGFNTNTGSQGAGLFVSLDSKAMVSRCTFAKNDASDNGGGASVNNASPTFSNCVFWRNSAGWGAGLYVWGKASTPTVNSCSFGANAASYEGAGMRNNMASPTVSNSVFWGDSPDEIAGIDDSAEFLYCDIQGGYAGESNIDISPLYADLAGGDLRIGYGSPCMDTGVKQDFPAVDTLGIVRPQGSAVDRGAYEIRANGIPAAMFNVTPPKGIYPVTVQFTDLSWPAGATITQWSWDFGDGETSDIANPVHTYENIGAYTVSLTVQTSLGSDTMTRNGCIVVQLPVHVNVRNTSGTYDGLSWETAYTTLQQGVDAAAAEEIGEVWVAAGTYVETSDVVLALKPGVGVYGGFAGAELTRDQRDVTANVATIDGEDTRRCVTGADNALLDGFVITRGYDDNYGGGIYNASVSPTVRNCTFTLNTSELGAAAFNSGGTAVFDTCDFSRNTTKDGGSGGASFNTEGAPQFLNCSFKYNTAYVGGAVFNQTTLALFTGAAFYYNYAVQGGGMFSSGDAGPEVTECRFISNTSENFGGGMFNGEGAATAVTRCFFVDNTGAYGGAIGNDSATPLFTNCVIVANTASDGCAIYNRASSAVIVNCTIADNTGSGFTPRAVRNDSDSAAEIINCILWNPRMYDLPLATDATYTVTYSLIRSGYTGTGNISDDPLFVGSGDNPYALQTGSPAIDTGRNTNIPALGSITTDILGIPRGLDGDGAGANTGDTKEFDMGAYEYVP